MKGFGAWLRASAQRSGDALIPESSPMKYPKCSQYKCAKSLCLAKTSSGHEGLVEGAGKLVPVL
jgi:hypothetical protein